MPFFFSSLFRCLFGSIFGAFLLPTWLPKSTKIDQKSMLKALPFSLAFFDRFLIEFWSQLRSPKPKKSLKNHWFYRLFCKMGLTKLRSIFGAFFVPTWLHFASQNPPKTLQRPTPRRIKILINFCIVFFSFWAPSWEPSWGHVGHYFRQNGATQIDASHLFLGFI